MSLSHAVRYLREYVAIPSVNPMGRTDIDPAITGELRYAQHLHEQLRGLAVDSVLCGRGDRASVIGRVHVADHAETILVASHLDTVPVDGMSIPAFDPAIRNDRLYGRGACDTKAGMAALIAALAHVLSRGTLRRNCIVVGEADEEMGSAGVFDVLSHLQGSKPDWALATEPTGLRLVTCHKGRVTLRLAAHGQACHSSDPDRGQNAIQSLARAAIALDALHRELHDRPDPRLGPATLAVTQIQGGHASNIVPDRALLIADRRTLPHETQQQLTSEVERCLAQHGLSEQVLIEHVQNEKNALGTADDHPAALACQHALRACGLPDRCGVAAFATDAGPLAAHGIASVVIGPGEITDAHTADESVELAQVDAMQRFFERLLTSESANR